MRFCIGVGNDEECTSLIVGPQGHLITYPDAESAGEAAQQVVAELSGRGMPVGVFTYKLVAVALYSPRFATPEPRDPGAPPDTNAN